MAASRQTAYDEIFRRPKPQQYQQQQPSYQPDYPPGAQPPYHPPPRPATGASSTPSYSLRPGQQRASYYQQPSPQSYSSQPAHGGAGAAAYSGAGQQRNQSPYYGGGAGPASYTSPDLGQQQGQWQQHAPHQPHYAQEAGIPHPEQQPQQPQQRFTSPRSTYAPTMSSGPSSASTSTSLYSRPSVSSTTTAPYPYSQGHNGTSTSTLPPAVSLSPAASPMTSSVSLSSSGGAPQLPAFNPPQDDFFGFESSRTQELREGEQAGWQGAATGAPGGPRGGSPGSLYDPGQYDDVERPSSLYSGTSTPYHDGGGAYGGASFDFHSRRSSGDSDRQSLYRGSGFDPRPLTAIHPSYASSNSYLPYGNGSPTPSNASIHPRRSSESMRVLPTQPKAPHGQDRAFSFSSSERPNMHSHDSSASGRPFSGTSASGSAVVPRRAPVVYPALLSRVAEAFKTRIVVNERVKDGLVYPDTFDGRDAVDKIAYIIKTSDRNLALLLGRALDAQKFFHDVTYDHRLRDSPVELYQFRERLASPFLSSDDLSPAVDGYNPTPPARPHSVADTVASAEDSFPSGVFTLLTDCYSPTCTRDRLCYSIACPRRLEQQARLNLKPKPGLQRSISSESLGDLREPGSLWIHSVPQEIADSTSDQEKKRQEALNEVFYTERDFVRDLEYLRDCWIKPLRTQNIIPEDRREDFVTQVFWNVLEIYAVNVRLAELLNRRQKAGHVVEKIGDIFLDLVPHFGPFVKYGAHQLYGKYEFEKEKGSNPAFAKFVDETERLPESRKLELNGYLTKPTTRLARYPLLLEACLKSTPDDNPDKVILPKVVKLVREFLAKVNVESGKSENRFNLAQLDQQLVFKNGEAVDLRLRDEDREMIYKGPLKKRGGTQSESAELQVFLFDHAILMVKQKSKNEQYKVYRKPIPLELLVVAPTDDAATARAGAVRPKSLMARGTATKHLAQPPPGVDKNSKQGFAMTFIHLGRRGYQITVWAASWATRKKWLEKIEGRQNELRERSLVFETLPLSSGYFVGTNRVTCAAPFDNGNRMVYGTDNGVYLSDLREHNKVPVKVISVPNVTQLDVLEEQGILIVLADKAVQTFFVDHLDPGDALGAAKRARKISSHATFFKAGQCLGRTLVCVVKSGSVSSTIKTLEPIDQVRGKKQPAIRKFLQGSNESLRVFKEFYIPTESSSVHFLKSKLCVGCTKGFEIVDLETLDTQGLLDPADSSLDFVQKRENARPIAIYRIDGEFLLCYDEFAFYVNKNGWRAKSNWIIQWEGFPTSFALHYPYVLAFEPTFIEVRHVESGALMQIIPGNNIRCLFADTPPSASSSSANSYFPSPNAPYGYRGPPVSSARSEIIVSDGDKCFSLQFTAADS